MGTFLEGWLRDMERSRLIQEEQDQVMREKQSLVADRNLLEGARAIKSELEEVKKNLAAREREVSDLRSSASESAKRLQELGSEAEQARKELEQKDLELGREKKKNESLAKKKSDLLSDKKELEEEVDRLRQELTSTKEGSKLALQRMKKGAALKLYSGYWGTIRVLRKRYPGINLGDVDAIFDEIGELSPEPVPIEEAEEEEEGQDEEEGGDGVQGGEVDGGVPGDPVVGGEGAEVLAGDIGEDRPLPPPLSVVPEAFLASAAGQSGDTDPDLEVLGSFPAPAASGTNENPP